MQRSLLLERICSCRQGRCRGSPHSHSPSLGRRASLAPADAAFGLEVRPLVVCLHSCGRGWCLCWFPYPEAAAVAHRLGLAACGDGRPRALCAQRRPRPGSPFDLNAPGAPSARAARTRDSSRSHPRVPTSPCPPRRAHPARAHPARVHPACPPRRAHPAVPTPPARTRPQVSGLFWFAALGLAAKIEAESVATQFEGWQSEGKPWKYTPGDFSFDPCASPLASLTKSPLLDSPPCLMCLMWSQMLAPLLPALFRTAARLLRQGVGAALHMCVPMHESTRACLLVRGWARADALRSPSVLRSFFVLAGRASAARSPTSGPTPFRTPTSRLTATCAAHMIQLRT